MKASKPVLTEKILFLDLDGVFVDFTRGVLERHNLPASTQDLFKGDYDIMKFVGMSTTQFWIHLDQDESFWENLNPTEDGHLIMEQVEQHNNKENIKIFFCSSPALNPNCYSGKAKWIKKHYPKMQNKIILTNHKYLFAAKNRFLLDDSDKNINEFKKHGGIGILVARPWNSKYLFKDNTVELLTKELNRFL